MADLIALAGVPRAAAVMASGLLGVRPGVAATAALDAASLSHHTWSSRTCRVERQPLLSKSLRARSGTAEHRRPRHSRMKHGSQVMYAGQSAGKGVRELHQVCKVRHSGELLVRCQSALDVLDLQPCRRHTITHTAAQH